MGGTEALIAAAVVSAIGAGYGGYTAYKGSKDAKERAAAAAAEQRRVQAQRDGNIRQLRALFGQGDTPDAQSNQKRIADSIREFYGAKLDANLRGVEDQFAGASRVSRQNLARVGQLGSGLDASTRSGNLADFIRGRQRAVADAASSRTALEGRLAGQRQTLESQISSGSLANPDFSGVISQQQGILDQAQSQIAPAAIGNLFDVAGSTYFGGRVNEAIGNQGLQAFNSGGGSGGGRVTARS